MQLKVLHLAAANRWTGAAAPAFVEVEALRGVGIEAHYAYVGGYRLEDKIGHHDFVHAAIDRAQNPLAFLRSLRALRGLAARIGFDIVHSHLTYDHWLATSLARRRGMRCIRTIHARRVMRRDPLSRYLFSRTDAFCVINASFLNDQALSGHPVVFTPPPLDTRQFKPEGPDVRGTYGIEPDATLMTVIGKVTPGRGFEEALQTFAIARHKVPRARMMVIGRGPLRPQLEALAATLGIAELVTFAGYHEDDLAEHYRASDLLMFTAPGSDEGHRAVTEAMACGVPAVTFPIEGMEALVPTRLIASNGTPEALAETIAATVSGDLAGLSREVARQALAFDYGASAARLRQLYDQVMAK